MALRAGARKTSEMKRNGRPVARRIQYWENPMIREKFPVLRQVLRSPNGKKGAQCPLPLSLLPVVGAIATVTLVFLVPAARSALLFVFFAVFTLGICGHNYSPLQLILESSAALSNIRPTPLSSGKFALSCKSLASSDSSKFRNENTEKI
jgi:hypothetical protein